MARSKKQPLLEAGTAFVFRLPDGRYGVCRVLRRANGSELRSLGAPYVLVATSAWMGDAVPDPADPALRPILRNTRAYPNGGQPVLDWLDEPPPREFKRIGVIPPTAIERRLKCDSSGFWENSPIMLFGLWRWEHDREALLAEEAAEDEQEQRKLDARNVVIETEQRSMSLEKLSKYRFFANWKDSPAKEAIRASRATMKMAVGALIALGPKATKAKKKQVLKDCIKEFNELDRTMNRFIETSERDDICSEFDLLVHACGLGEYKSLADEWRDW